MSFPGISPRVWQSLWHIRQIYSKVTSYKDSFYNKGTDIWENLLEDKIRERSQQAMKQGMEQGIEQGINAMIASYLEDGFAEEDIINRLVHHFSMTEKQAAQYCSHFTESKRGRL